MPHNVGDDTDNTIEGGDKQRHHVHHHKHDHHRLSETSKDLQDGALRAMRTPSRVSSGGSTVTIERQTRYFINFFIKSLYFINFFTHVY